MKRVGLFVVGISLSLLINAHSVSAGAETPGSVSDDIPAGTKITMQNWHQYASFMPAGRVMSRASLNLTAAAAVGIATQPPQLRQASKRLLAMRA